MRIGRSITAMALASALAFTLAWKTRPDGGRAVPASAENAAAAAERSKIDDLLATQPIVPEGVVYEITTAEENRSAIERLTKAFLGSSEIVSEDLCGPTLICGPGLWAKIKDDVELKQIATGVTSFRVPKGDQVQVFEGKLLQNPKEVATFWRAFARRFPRDPAATVRRPTAQELSLYWAMTPFDITEPVFVVESQNNTLFFDLSGGDAKIQWVDDYQDLHLESPLRPK